MKFLQAVLCILQIITYFENGLVQERAKSEVFELSYVLALNKLDPVFSSPEPKAHRRVYRILMVWRRPSSTMFKDLLLRNRLANQS